MREIVVLLPPDVDARIRLEAARIHQFRRQISRSNALKELDSQVVQEAATAGLSRGAAFTHADSFIAAVHSRLTELDRQIGERTIVRNVIAMSPPRGAAA